jgi:hypothetical protein
VHGRLLFKVVRAAEQFQPQSRIFAPLQPLNTMNGAEFHLLVNHIPLFAVAFAALALVAGLVWKARPLHGFAGVLLIVAGISGLLAHTSGEDAEHLVEGLPGVEEQYLERHEEMADTLHFPLIFAAVFGAVVVVLVWKNNKWQRTVAGVCAAYALGMTIWVGVVAHSGGEIRHPEVRANWVPQPPTSETGPNESTEAHESETDH